MSDALFDTSVFIDWWRGSTGTVNLVDAVKDGRLTASYSSMTIAELWQWDQLDRKEEIEYVALTSRYLEEASLGFEEARLAGTWLRGYGRNQRRKLFADALIAATAQLRRETVYSGNYRQLRRFYPDVQPYLTPPPAP
jgi:predicted nucleic acid-binding protein